jgi:thiamine biosynthesis lipoprotein
MLIGIKKIGLMIIVFAIAIAFSTCDTSEEMHSVTFYDYMYTSITVSLYTTEDKADAYFEVIKDMYAMYDALTNNYEGLPEDTSYLENIYTINQQKDVTLEIDGALYELIQKALSIQTLTEGYFNIGLGKPAKAWKALISKTSSDVTIGTNLYVRTYNSAPVYSTYEVKAITETTYELFDGEMTDVYDINKLIYDIELTQTTFQQTMATIDSMSIENNDILLEEANNTYYITISGSDIELDVGAFSKGYTTEKVKQYLLEQDVTYFSISAGSSTISVGQNINRPSQDEVYIVSLTDPITSLPFFKEPYGLIHIKNQSLATSGNFEQFTMYEGKRYHHLISPFTLSPTHDYAALTIVGDDAGLLDALSTALFVMPKDVFDRFMKTHQTSLNIQVIRYNTDNTSDTFISDLYFEDLMS